MQCSAVRSTRYTRDRLAAATAVNRVAMHVHPCWCKHLGVTGEELIAAVKVVGLSVFAVKKYLGKQ